MNDRDRDAAHRIYGYRCATTTARTGVLAPLVSSCVGPCGSMLAKFVNLADFRPFKKMWTRLNLAIAIYYCNILQ